jgi:hypothetical protein
VSTITERGQRDADPFMRFYISAIDRHAGDVHLFCETPRLAENDVIRVRCIPHSAYRVKRDSLSPALQKGWAFFRQNYAQIVPMHIARALFFTTGAKQILIRALNYVVF